MTDPRPSSEPTADATLPLSWSEFIESQQRWWSEWLEAGQIWSSWWFSQIPPVNWPPVGEVLPPRSPGEPGTAEQRLHPGMPAHAPRQAGPAEPPLRPSRARSARHH